MILNSKQLEELENIQDSSGEFEEEAGDSDGYVEGVENALAWRRGMIERAVINIRKLLRKPMESMDGLATGSLVYLKESKRFVRIHENLDGHTELSFVGPTPSQTPVKPEKLSKAEKQAKAEKPAKAEKAPKAEKPVAVKPVAVVPQMPAKKAETPIATKKAEPASKKPEPAKKQKVEAKKIESKKEKTSTKAKSSVSKKTAAGKSGAEKATKKVALKPVKKPAKAVTKPKLKKAPAKKIAQKTKATPKKHVAKKMPRKSASNYMMDPVADPNGYIRGNFRLMSNKELSHITGLSEHTIRRKLGEWGLKRI